MSYQVFARKWRPQNFDEVIGQEHIITTLKNAIELDRVGHAYLFAGPRGTGKTSTARIFAKALNCEKGPTTNSCGKCNFCLEISEGRSLDVIEIDGASNRRIDEIRDLKENVKFSPAAAKFKIYIIDEVHMLTQEAFNALLKTLEEPPAHIKFIFATTRAYKLPVTILSRCQRFDFRRILCNDIVSKLKKICQKEKIEADELALFTIAKISDGSIRDAESILDQMVSLCESKIKVANITSSLGIMSQEHLCLLIDKIIAKDASSVLAIVNQIINSGKDIFDCLSNIIQYFRNLLVVKLNVQEPEVLDLPEEYIKEISIQADKFTLEELLYATQILIDTRNTAQHSAVPRVPIEITLTKLSLREKIVSLEDMIKRLRELEEKISTQPKIQETSAANQNCSGRFLPNPRCHAQTSPKADSNTSYIKLSEKQEQNDKLYDNPSMQSNSVENEEKITQSSQQENTNENNPLGVDKVKNLWPVFINQLEKEKISIASCLEKAKPVNIKNEQITLAFQFGTNFQKETVEQSKNKRLIEKLFSKLSGKNIKFSFKINDNKPTVEKDSQTEQKQNTLIEKAIQLFQAKIIHSGK